jgi:sodium/hydrogen exchanger 8
MAREQSWSVALYCHLPTFVCHCSGLERKFRDRFIARLKITAITVSFAHTFYHTHQKFLHDRPRLGSLLPEAAMIILVGITAGIFIHLTTGRPDNESMAGDVADSMLAFSPTVFFVILLPPIIFNSGYHLHRALFFRYMAPICLFACLGTAICTVVVASIMYALAPLIGIQPTFLELMAFGALISATDPVSTLAVFSSKKVDPHLFYLVFGESVINDAVGLVLFEALAHLVEIESVQQVNPGREVLRFVFEFSTGFFGSLVLGIGFGLAFALFLKHIDFRHTPVLELSIYVTILYAPFVVAELCHLSGIVTCLFTGIAARRYAEPNVSPKSASNADTIFRLTAQLTETLIFLELGMSVVEVIGYDGAFNMMFIVLALVACLIGRACNIYPIAFLYNLSVRDDESTYPSNEVVLDGSKEGYVLEEAATEKVLVNDIKIPMNFTHMLWYSGLRGAVSYALVRTFPDTPNRNVFVVTTMMIVLITTFFLGGTTEAALQYLSIPMEMDEEKYMASLRKKRLLSACLGRAERRVRGWVLRDEALMSEDALDQEMDGYSDHVEMTERDHHDIVGSPKKQTIYDFGQ